MRGLRALRYVQCSSCQRHFMKRRRSTTTQYQSPLNRRKEVPENSHGASRASRRPAWQPSPLVEGDIEAIFEYASDAALTALMTGVA